MTGRFAPGAAVHSRPFMDLKDGLSPSYRSAKAAFSASYGKIHSAVDIQSRISSAWSEGSPLADR